MAGTCCSLISYGLILALASTFTTASPVQFCKTTKDFNFCLAYESFYNLTSSTNDAYITFVTTRETNSDIGWNAVGLGDEMRGSLMFVMYGDPKSKTGPTVSIRSAQGHQEPQVIEKFGPDAPFPDVRVAGSEYISMKDSPQNTLAAHLICYGCDNWTGREVDQPFQPWIWAVNTEQDFAGNFDVHASLQAHSFVDGMGVFWTNVVKSQASDQTVAAVPAITNTKSNINAQDTQPSGLTTVVGSPAPPHSSFRARMWAIHGFLMSLSVLLLHPLGVIAMRGGIPNAFKYHWLIQVSATLVSLVGMLMGILLSRAFTRWHQYIGFLLLLSLLIQPVLGYQHHRIYLRTRSKTVLSPYHIWLGRSVQMLSWLNLLFGMVLKHWTFLWIMLAMALIMVEMGAVFFSPALVGFVRKYKPLDDMLDHRGRHHNIDGTARGQGWEEYLDMSDQEDDDEDGDGQEVYSSEQHGAMPGTGFLSGIPKEGLDEEVEADKKNWLPAGR